MAEVSSTRRVTRCTDRRHDGLEGAEQTRPGHAEDTPHFRGEPGVAGAVPKGHAAQRDGNLLHFRQDPELGQGTLRLRPHGERRLRRRPSGPLLVDGDVEALRVQARRERQAGDAAPDNGYGFHGPMLCPAAVKPDGGSRVARPRC